MGVDNCLKSEKENYVNYEFLKSMDKSDEHEKCDCEYCMEIEECKLCAFCKNCIKNSL